MITDDGKTQKSHSVATAKREQKIKTHDSAHCAAGGRVANVRDTIDTIDDSSPSL